MHDRETMFSHAAQAATETFAASLETIGLVLADGWNGEGALFEGDGSRCEGWYWAWEARRSFSVVCCDFTLKERLPFCFDSGGYFAVRRERHGLMPQSSVSAFLETKPKTSSVLLPKGARFSYTEIEYYDEYCRSVFGERIDKALKPLATSLKGLRNQASWDPEIAEMLGKITPRETPGPEAGLLYSGIANLVMARLLRMGESLCEGVAEQDRLSIARAVSYIESNLGGVIRQKDLLEAANMGSTKFKKTFKQVTGLTVTEFISSERIELAKKTARQPGHEHRRDSPSLRIRKGDELLRSLHEIGWRVSPHVAVGREGRLRRRSGIEDAECHREKTRRRRVDHDNGEAVVSSRRDKNEFLLNCEIVPLSFSQNGN